MNKIKKTFLIIAIAVAVIVIIGATWYIKENIDNKKFDSEKYKIDEQHKQEVADAMSVEQSVKFNHAYYDSLDVLTDKIMQLELELSHQDPEKNEEYDSRINEFWDFGHDPPPKAAEIADEVEKIDSTYFEYRDKYYDYSVDFIAYHHDRFKGKEPFFYFNFKKPVRKIASKLKFAAGGYISYNGAAGTFGYEPFDWLQVNVMISGNKMIVDGTEHIFFNPWLGAEYSF